MQTIPVLTVLFVVLFIVNAGCLAYLFVLARKKKPTKRKIKFTYSRGAFFFTIGGESHYFHGAKDAPDGPNYKRALRAFHDAIVAHKRKKKN